MGRTAARTDDYRSELELIRARASRTSIAKMSDLDTTVITLMFEIIEIYTDGRKICREHKFSDTVYLPDDVTAIEVNVIPEATDF